MLKLCAPPSWLFFFALAAATLAAAEPTTSPQRQGTRAEGAEFFEKEIRPLLVERCHKCHGGPKVKGGLRLTSRANLLKGGESGPAVVLGKPDDSLLIKAIRYNDTPQMPPTEKLKARDIARLTRWVAMGVPWPETTRDQPPAAGAKGPYQITDEQRRFWSFQPIQSVAPPAVTDTSWPRSGLDRFILAGLEAKGLKPAPPADKRTLLRRTTFDLTGLPPTPDEMDAFLRDDSPDAFARVVDRLLASPQYGERWGRHWLDVVRYADSFDLRGIGGEMDIADAWRYRDWVVNAFNRDLPYNQFITEQIAGDLLRTPSPLPSPPGGGEGKGEGEGVNADGIVATGMLAIGNWGGGDADKEKLLTDIVDDQIDVVGRAFLGLTLACARCHDHKFDPIPTDDYYSLAGIFFSTHILPNVGLKTDGPPMLRIPLARPAVVQAYQQYEARLAQLQKQIGQMTLRQAVALLGQANPYGQQLFLARLQVELATLKKHPPASVPYANGAQEGGVPGSPHAGIHDIRVHIRGRYDRLGDRVPRRFPRILAGENQTPITQGSGRLQLAQWLTQPEHPLTTRVIVNRIWQHHFGDGIVRTPSNFGKQGERPTHPELLDYLARQFVASGWSIKQMHRTILLSATYRQSSTAAAETLKADPDNRLFCRMNRRRLEAEAIRDNLLAVSGRLDLTMGGPAVSDFAAARRTLYLMTIRSDRTGFRPLFDVADSTAPVDRRTVSTVAPQALFLLNHPFVLEQNRMLAKRIAAEGGSDDRTRIQKAYALLYGRPPAPEEVRIGVDFLGRPGIARESAWEEYCQVLLCANEFIYVD
jgi:hypothetical protein